MKKVIFLSVLIATIGLMTIGNAVSQTATSNIKTFTESNFNANIKSGLILVDFYADWCKPCKMMKPILEEVAGENKSKITIAGVNTDNNPTLSQKYNISGIPCMILFKDGKEVKRIVGYHDKAQLLEKLTDYL